MSADAVGLFVTVTLVTGLQLKGVIYTYNPKPGILVLFENITDTVNLKMLNTAFIKDIEVHEESPIQLPGALDAYSTLPSMTAGNTEKSIYRVATEKLNSGKQRRLKLLSAVQPDVCIGAVTTLTKVSRVYPGISWEASKNVIQVSPEVTIIGDPDWSTPVVKLQENASTDAVALSKKVQHTLSQQ